MWCLFNFQKVFRNVFRRLEFLYNWDFAVLQKLVKKFRRLSLKFKQVWRCYWNSLIIILECLFIVKYVDYFYFPLKEHHKTELQQVIKLRYKLFEIRQFMNMHYKVTIKCISFVHKKLCNGLYECRWRHVNVIKVYESLHSVQKCEFNLRITTIEKQRITLHRARMNTKINLNTNINKANYKQ